MKKLYFLFLLVALSCQNDKAGPKLIHNDFKISEAGKNFIIEREGYRDYAYWDGHLWAIGFGNTYYENGERVRKGDRINRERAGLLFDDVVKDFEACVNDNVTSEINQTQFDALVSYAYNRGCGKFKGTRLLKEVNENPENPEIRTLFEIEWGSNKPYRNGLIKRRRMEAEMYFSENPVSTGSTSKKYLFILGIAIAGAFLFRVQIIEFIGKWELKRKY